MVEEFTKEGKTHIVFKCPYENCRLFYDNSLGLRRHIMEYNHKLFYMRKLMDKCPQYNCSWTKGLDKKPSLSQHVEKNHDSVNHEKIKEVYAKSKKLIDCNIEKLIDNDLINHSRRILKHEKKRKLEIEITFQDIFKKDNIVSKVLNFSFKNAIVQMNDLEKPEIFFCGISGCGKHFKSIMAYKYHCSTFQHSFFSLYDSFCRSSNLDLEYESLKSIFLDNFHISDRFVLSGLMHHSTFAPDQSFPLIFSISKDYVLKTKRQKKREMNITEYNAFFTDDFSMTEISENSDNIPSKILFQGIKYESTTANENKKFKFYDLKEEITASYRFKNIFCICTSKSNLSNKKIFEFYTGISTIFFYKNSTEFKKIVTNNGFIRKIEIHSITDSINFFCLSNDGIVRFYKNDKIIFEFDENKIIGFVILENYKNEEIILTSGFNLYKYRKGILLNKSTEFIYPILDIVFRNIDENQNDEELYLLDANGKISYCDTEFRNEQFLFTNVGTTSILYLKDVDGILICDSFLGTTKLFNLKTKKISILQSNFTSCAENLNKSIISGTFNGQIISNQITNRQKISSELLFKLIRRKDFYILCYEEKEFEFFSATADTEFDLLVCIIFIYHINNYYVFGLNNGFVIFVEI